MLLLTIIQSSSFHLNPTVSKTESERSQDHQIRKINRS